MANFIGKKTALLVSPILLMSSFFYMQTYYRSNQQAYKDSELLTVSREQHMIESYINLTNFDSGRKVKKEVHTNDKKTGIKVNQLERKSLIENKVKEHGKSESTLVLLVSSSARSGSSFIGETLSTSESSVMFFEPLHMLQNNNDLCLETKSCVNEYLDNILNCNMTEEYIKYFSRRLTFMGFFNEETRKCQDKPKEHQASCIKKVDMRKRCKEASVRLTKTIRLRLANLEPLLEKSKNVKVIHLLRDPRGTLNSIRKFKWGYNVPGSCTNLTIDISSYQDLKLKYPDQIEQVNYEDFSINPIESSKRLFKFLYDFDTLPKNTIAYLDSHTEKSVSGSMSRSKNSKQVFQKWREEIPKDIFKQVESNENCMSTIRFMGHRLFETLSNARNLSIPLFVDENIR